MDCTKKIIPHILHIGERVFDTLSCEWARVGLINGKEEDLEINEDTADAIVTLEMEVGESETEACNCYCLAPNRYFWGEEVCWEHYDFGDLDHDYDFYCPARDENCWAFEVA